MAKQQGKEAQKGSARLKLLGSVAGDAFQNYSEMQVFWFYIFSFMSQRHCCFHAFGCGMQAIGNVLGNFRFQCD